MIRTAQPVRATLTKRQSEILDYITRFIEEHRYSPSYRDLSTHFRVQVNAIRGQIIALRRKGYIEFDANRSRTIRPVETAQNGPSDLEVLATVAWACVHAPLRHFNEVADRLGCDRLTVANRLERLRSQGFITWDPPCADSFSFRLLSPNVHHVSNHYLRRSL